MGLKISSLDAFPVEAKLKFYVYFLDYGWDDELSKAMYSNFDKLSQSAERSASVVMQGMHREHFANEVLSWHSINQENAEELLPAILITDTNPRELQQSNQDNIDQKFAKNISDVVPGRFVILPLKNACSSASEVTTLLRSISNCLESNSILKDFKIVKDLKKRAVGFADVFIAQPSAFGIGIDLKKLFELGRQKLVSLNVKQRDD